MGGHVGMQGSGHVPPMHMQQQPQNTPPQNTFVREYSQFSFIPEQFDQNIWIF